MHGGEITNRAQQVRNDLGFGLGDSDAGRRRLIAGEELLDPLAAEVIEPDQAADHHGQNSSDDHEPAQHPNGTARFFG